MDGKTLLDRAVSIIARTDVNRQLLLTFVNEAIKTYLSNKTLTRFRVARSFTSASGLIATPTLKNAYDVRYAGAILTKIPTIDMAYQLYGNDLGGSGTPLHYFLADQSIQLIPTPVDGSTVTVIGEFWPDDLADSVTSSNTFSSELPLGMIYLGVAEYMDFLQEEQRGEYWRGKGSGVIAQWLATLRKQEFTKVHNLQRDPLGNLGYNRRTPPIVSTNSDIVESETVHDPGVD